MRLPKRKSEELARSKEAEPDRYLTRPAIERLERDLQKLETIERPKAAAEVRRTGEMGDFSENAAYQMAKANLRRINGRILSLQERLKMAIPIEGGSDDGRVQIGSTVVVKAGGREKTFRILGSQESNPTKGRISYLSPLGSALMGRAAGEKASAHEVEYEIVSVA